MRNWSMFGHAVRSMLLLTLAISVLSSVALAQIARIEVHPIQSVTVTDQQFLKGDKNGEPVVIGGELQMPVGEGRFPAVILVHGWGGVGASIDRWAHQLNGIGVAVFILDATFIGGASCRGIGKRSRKTLLSIRDLH